ncbi:MAG: hypothetical protein JWO63_2387, partial [Frankiales bacterium]|nr:hypothetical protein [Frankiales bacterium]
DPQDSMQAALIVGIATGLVMARSDVTEDEANDLLRAASDRTGLGMAEVAAEYVETGYVGLA